MASRGGAGGARGGRGRGRGGGSKPQLPIGHLLYADIIAQSKVDTGVLYPPTEECDTDFPSHEEAQQANLYNRLLQEAKFKPTWLDLPDDTQMDIERYEDIYKHFSSIDATMREDEPLDLVRWKDHKEFHRNLLPSNVYEAVWLRRANANKRSAVGDGVGENGAKKKKRNFTAALNGVDETFDEHRSVAGSQNSNSEGEEDDDEEDLDRLEEDEEEEGDYDDNYFDNGEDDDGDVVGAGGGGGGDDDGGVFD